MKSLPCIIAISFASAAPAARPGLVASPPGGEQIVDLALAGGGHHRILYERFAHPRAALVMLPGGSGEIGVAPDGDIEHAQNFIVRTRLQWVALGYALLIPDTVDRANLRGARSSSGYARLVDELADYAHARTSASVLLLGTSQGSIAAMNGAAHARPGLVGGVILTESVSVMGHSGETVFDADPQDVRVPALIVANRDDRCDVAPPAMDPRIAGVFRRAGTYRRRRHLVVGKRVRVAVTARLLRHRTSGHRFYCGLAAQTRRLTTSRAGRCAAVAFYSTGAGEGRSDEIERDGRESGNTESSRSPASPNWRWTIPPISQR